MRELKGPSAGGIVGPGLKQHDLCARFLREARSEDTARRSGAQDENPHSLTGSQATAIHDHYLAGDEAGGIGEQEDDRPGGLGRRTDPPER